MSKLLSFDEARRKLSLGEEEFRRLVEDGGLPSVRAERLFFRPEDLEALLRACEDDSVFVELPELQEVGLRPSAGLLSGRPSEPWGASLRRWWARMLGTSAGDAAIRSRLSLDRGEDLKGRARVDRASAAAEALWLGGAARLYARPLRAAGALRGTTGSLYVLGKLALVAGVLAVVLVLPAPWGLAGRLENATWLTFAVPALAWALPDVALWLLIRGYRRRIQGDLPFWLDLHATLVEGGMGFDEALARICAETAFLRKSIFAELREVQRRIGLGTSRAAALQGMAERLKVEGLDAVVGALVQGEQMGAGVADTLRAQADMVRNKVWEDAQARAQKLPIKLLFPIAVGVLPSVFLVTVGPPVLRLIQFVDGGLTPF